MAKNLKNSARGLALLSLLGVERDGKYSNLEISSTLERSGLSEADRALYTRLVYGVVERKITLDHIIGQYSRIPTERLDDDVRCALRLGLYQLTYMDKIPAHSAVDESVSLVSGSKTGFVNATLRAYLRAGKKFTLPQESDRVKHLSVKYSVGEDVVRVLTYSAVDVEMMLASMETQPRVALRVNTRRLTALEAAERLSAELSATAPDVVLADSLSAEVREGIEAGEWFVQDESSRITSAAVGARAGELVIDTCACPGGKSFSMAIDMEDTGRLISCDLHKNKLSLITKGTERLGIGIIETHERDGRDPMPEYIEKADRVLCDAPCSGLGVMAKKPEIRYKDAASIENLPKIQLAILEGASRYVRSGGTLVYSTCTVNRRENEDVVARFLESHPEFTLSDDKYLPGGMKTFLPYIDGGDGFFAAKMKSYKDIK